jgi:RNA polymerase sigma factor (sigma-70 family)
MRSDAALVRRFRAGDEAAFGALHARYAEGIRRYSAYMLRGTVHDADDAAQDVFLRAYQSMRRDEREIDVRPWLFRVAHNRCIDVLRRPVSDTLDDRTPGGAGNDPATAIERRETMRALLRDIGQLTDGQRSALLLRELGGLSHEGVGEALGISPTSSRMLVHRARLALTDAAQARDTTCHEVRERLVTASDLATKLVRRDRRHLSACAECRAFRRAHAGVERELSLLAPAGIGLGGVLKLFGGGGAAAGGGGAAATTGSTSLISGTAAKLTVAACCALVAGGGAVVGVKEATRYQPAAPRAQRSAPKATATAPTVTVRATTAVRTHTAAPSSAVAVHGRPRTTTSTASASTSPTAAPPAREDPASSVDLAGLEGADAPPATPAPAPKHTTTVDLADLEGH